MLFKLVKSRKKVCLESKHIQSFDDKCYLYFYRRVTNPSTFRPLRHTRIQIFPQLILKLCKWRVGWMNLKCYKWTAGAGRMIVLIWI